MIQCLLGVGFVAGGVGTEILHPQLYGVRVLGMGIPEHT